jgi:hypothetical protein
MNSKTQTKARSYPQMTDREYAIALAKQAKEVGSQLKPKKVLMQLLLQEAATMIEQLLTPKPTHP